MGHVRKFLAEAGIGEDFRKEICAKLYKDIDETEFINFMISKGFAKEFAKGILKVRSAC